MKIIEFKVKANEDIYVLNGDVEFEDENIMWSVIEAQVIKNGAEMTEFGETWAGSKLNARDMAYSIMAAYLDDDTTVEVIYVCDELKEYKNKFQSYMDIDGIKTPMHFIDTLGDTAHLVAVIRNNDGDVHRYYLNVNAGMTVMTSKDGSVMTDVQGFFDGALAGDLKDGIILYRAKDADFLDTFADGYLDEEDEDD